LGKTLAVIGVFEDGIPAPVGLALTAEGDLLVVSRGEASQVFKIDLEDDQNTSITRFAYHRDFVNSRYITIDANGYVYIDTSRAISTKQTGPSALAKKRITWAGIFQISPDGKTITRIEGIDDDTMGLAVDPDGNLFACIAESPINQHDMASQVAEKSAERMFESSKAIKPHILKFELGDDSTLDSRSDVVKNMKVTPSGITFDSEGNLFFVAGGTVLKVKFGILGASRPKAFAILPTAKAKATRYLAISADNSDNLYVSATNPYKLASGTIFKVDPEGEVTTFAKGLSHPTDCIADSEGNIYIADLKAEKVFQVPAEALHLGGPFRIKKPPPPVVTPPVQPVVADKPETEKGEGEPSPPVKPVAADEPKIETKAPAPPVVEPELDITRMTYKELSEKLASVDKELREKQALAYPDTIVLKGGREMKGEIVSETEDSVFARMSSGGASIMRSRIEIVIYATEEEKGRALQAKSEAEELQEQRSMIKLRMRELKPPVRRQKRPALYDHYGDTEYEEEDEY
jgi:hypothetical protein